MKLWLGLAGYISRWPGFARGCAASKFTTEPRTSQPFEPRAEQNNRRFLCTNPLKRALTKKTIGTTCLRFCCSIMGMARCAIWSVRVRTRGTPTARRGAMSPRTPPGTNPGASNRSRSCLRHRSGSMMPFSGCCRPCLHCIDSSARSWGGAKLRPPGKPWSADFTPALSRHACAESHAAVCSLGA